MSVKYVELIHNDHPRIYQGMIKKLDYENDILQTVWIDCGTRELVEVTGKVFGEQKLELNDFVKVLMSENGLIGVLVE
jgi:hypothetical protein